VAPRVASKQWERRELGEAAMRLRECVCRCVSARVFVFMFAQRVGGCEPKLVLTPAVPLPFIHSLALQ
jgi:hypothetical protein